MVFLQESSASLPSSKDWATLAQSFIIQIHGGLNLIWKIGISSFTQENYFLPSTFLKSIQTVQELKNLRSENHLCSKILSIDLSIRFVGILYKCGRLKAYDRKKGMVPQLNVSETKLVHQEALLKTKMDYIFDKKLGKTIVCRVKGHSKVDYSQHG